MNTTPLVSVIVAVKNETQLLIDCIASLQNQTYPNYEIIVIDDGSDVETVDILKNLPNYKTKILFQPGSMGQSVARNLGISEAKGKYIAIADADDVYHPNRLELQVEFMEANHQIDVLGSHFHTNNGKAWPLFQKNEDIICQMALNNPLVHSSVVIRASSLKNSSPYNPAYDTAEDYELFCRHSRDWHYSNLPKSLVTYHVKTHSVEKVADQKAKARKVREQFVQLHFEPLDASRMEQLHAFSELDPKLGLTKAQELIKILQTNKRTIRKAILNKILYRHLSQYCLKTREKPNLGLILKILRNGLNDLGSMPKTAYNLLKM